MSNDKTVVVIAAHDMEAIEQAWSLLPNSLEQIGVTMFMAMSQELDSQLSALGGGQIGRLIVVTNGFVLDDRQPMQGVRPTHVCQIQATQMRYRHGATLLNMCTHGMKPGEDSLLPPVVLREVMSLLGAEAA